MTVPKTTVNEDCLFKSREGEIGVPWQFCIVGTVTVSQSMKFPPEDHLRTGVAGSDTGHNFTAGFLGNSVRHAFTTMHKLSQSTEGGE